MYKIGFEAHDDFKVNLFNINKQGQLLLGDSVLKTKWDIK